MFDEHKKTLWLLAALTILMVALLWMVGSNGDITRLGRIGTTTDGELRRPTRANLESGKDYFAILKTNKGDIKIDLYELDAPYTVTNFIYLVENDFYDGSSFHRVLKEAFIQTGAPVDSESEESGPGYKFKDEQNNHKIVKGTVAMANEGPDTNGSQFFIVTKKALPELDGSYNVFGTIIDGFNVVERIAELNVEDNGFGEISSPTSEVIIKDVEIVLE